MILTRKSQQFLVFFMIFEMLSTVILATPSKNLQYSPQPESTTPAPYETTPDASSSYSASFLNYFWRRKTTVAPPKSDKLTSDYVTIISSQNPTFEEPQDDFGIRRLFEVVNETLLTIKNGTTIEDGTTIEEKASTDLWENFTLSFDDEFDSTKNQFTSSNEFFSTQFMGGDLEVNLKCKSCMESCMKNEFCVKSSTLNGDESTTEVNIGNSSQRRQNSPKRTSGSEGWSTVDGFESYSWNDTNEISSSTQEGFSSSPQSSNTPQENSYQSQSTSNSAQYFSNSPPLDLTTEISSTSTDSSQDSIERSILLQELIKVTEEFHNERVKFNLLRRELTEEQKKCQKLEKINEKLLFELQQSEKEIESQQKLVKNLKENSQICEQKLDLLSKNLDFVVKILEVERFKNGLKEKLIEFGMREEIETSNSTKLKFIMFELETEDSHVSLVSNQHLVTIPSRLADVAPSLSDFSASNCGLQFIDSSSFEDLESLRNLNLSGNFIAKIENETFGSLVNLEVLDLSFNLIENLEISAFLGLTNLLNLNLSNNKISSLPPQIFVELINLKVLTLSQNSIVELKIEIFSLKINLEEFYIDNNLLSFVEPKVIEGLEEALVVDMRNNYCIDSRVPDEGSLLKLGIHVSVKCRTGLVDFE